MVAILGLLAISIAILALVADWGPGEGRNAGCARLFVQCLSWGIGIGAATGGLIGVLIFLVPGLTKGTAGGVLALTPVGALYGVVIGAVLSVIPSVVGALAVTRLVSWRHPHPVSEEVVESDLGVIFAAVVAFLNVVLAVILLSGGEGLSSATRSLPFVVAANACVVSMLWRAKRPIARSWAGAAR